MDNKIAELQKEVRSISDKVAYMQHAIKGMSTDMRLITKEIQEIQNAIWK